MSWLLTSIQWYLYLLILGLIFFPLTKKILGRFSFDSGYGFSKIIAILFLSYTIFILSFLRILPFERINLFLIIIVSIVINFSLFKKDNKNINWRIIIIEEILFFLSFIAWTFIRGQESSIHSLEKFMDFGFINSILKTKYFPPLDMWLSREPINYYYFGHLTGAFLIKLTNILPYIGYNLLLSTIFALGITQVFSLSSNIISFLSKKNWFLPTFFGLLSAFIVNLGGNLHTIYAFTSGYNADKPVPFWQILTGFNPTKYWYPNATRFIPFTIHEFPSYSYVVADLHGHVFDIPFVLLTLAVLFLLFLKLKEKPDNKVDKIQSSKFKVQNYNAKLINLKLLTTNYPLLTSIFLGFLTAVHYMTNAFDGPIYLLLIIIVFLFIYRYSINFIINSAVLIMSFIFFALPFSLKFKPFVSGIGVNCSPDFLVNLKKLGPFLFEAEKCQTTPLWMLFVLWGFFLVSFALFLLVKYINRDSKEDQFMKRIDNFVLILFSFGVLLITIPISFYIKDIYPAHFRANTMFKLGYQAFIILGISSAYAFFRIRYLTNYILRIALKLIFLILFGFIAIYPLFSIPSFYGDLTRPVELNGSKWLRQSYPADTEIIDYLNKNVKNQPVILEAQGDSYTDFERVSSYTGFPTVAGWWVHEWLWRGSADIVGKRIPDVINLYESKNLNLTSSLIKKYQIKYVVVSELEKQKYKNLYEDKFNKLGRLIFKSSDKKGALYQLN